MSALGVDLALKGWTLRTGGAPGADQAFQHGAAYANGSIELYLPWASFEYENLPAPTEAQTTYDKPRADALELAEPLHPAWARLKPAVRNLMARNCHQVLGPSLDLLVDAVICWTPDGSLDGRGPDTGGTGMALRVARAYGSPLVINLARPEHFDFAASSVDQHL